VSGTVVLDIDPRNGGEDSLAKLEERHGTLPATLTAHTGGGGLHCFFRHPGHQKVPNRRDLGGLPGLDLKGDAAYIIAPPSNHASGSRYSWDEATNRENTLLVPCPEFLLRLAANSGVGGRVRYRNEAWDGSIPSRVEHILNEFEALYYAYNEAPALMAGLT
jgi:hypothetical protein